MNIIVTDTGFTPDQWSHGFVPLDQLAANDDDPVRAIDLRPDADVMVLQDDLDRIDLIRIDFPSFADGRGFSLARNLRRMGFAGRLRAKGHVLADQYAMARRAGFDEVEIDQDLAARQPEEQWQARADWEAHDYQARLRG
ncbi:MAG: DUF934 domain-containing protein [Pseudomonadota bacterium]